MTETLGVQGEFRLLHKIGEGGMADVFLAERMGDDGFRTRVALKRLHRGLAMDSYFINQLIREARLLGQLEHANIVKVFDLRRIGDEYYVVMEYVDGIDLAAVVKVHRKRKTRLPRPFFFHVALSLSEALSYAHAAIDEDGNATPLIHRDIKPSNVMLSRRGIVKLTDFGIAHVGDGSVTGGLVQGTANYMSPEQAFGEERLTPASDVYSLGSVFYELLCGKPLVDGDNYLKAIHQVRERRVTLDELASLGVEPGLRMVVAKMLSADLPGRYLEMESVRNDLQFVADRLKIDLSWHRTRAYVGRLMGILGRAPDRATLSNLRIPEEIKAAARQLGPGDEESSPAATPAHRPPSGGSPVTQAVQKDMLEQQLAESQLGPEPATPPTPRPALPVDQLPARDKDSETVALPGPVSLPTPGPTSSSASPITAPPTPPLPRTGGGSAVTPAPRPTPSLPPAVFDDANRTVVYRGKSPAEAGVMGTSEMRAIRREPALSGLQTAHSAQGLEAAPALVEFSGTGAAPAVSLGGASQPPTPTTAPPTPPAPPQPIPAPATEADTDAEVWIFTESMSEGNQAAPAAAEPPRRRKKRRKKRKRKPVPPLVAALLVILVFLVLAAIVLVILWKKNLVQAPPLEPEATRVVVADAPHDGSPEGTLSPRPGPNSR